MTSTFSLLTIPEAAQELGISVSRLRSSIDSGELDVVCIGRRRLIDERDLCQFIESMKRSRRAPSVRPMLEASEPRRRGEEQLTQVRRRT